MRIYDKKYPYLQKFIPSTVFLHRLNCWHGEQETMRQFAMHLTGAEVIMPALHESFDR